MATRTTFLKLTLPANDEFQDSWDQPANQNFQTIDDWAAGIETEIVDARFTKASLKEFLEVAHDDNGMLLPTPEIVNARNSFLYGDENLAAADFDLQARLNEIDFELFAARSGYTALRDSLASRALLADQILSGAATGAGVPTWLGFTGANAQIDGSVTNLILMIGGQIARVRTLKQLTISGVAGLKHLYATRTADGVANVTSSAATAGSDGSKVRILQDLAVDFTAQDVQPGDVLTILGTGPLAGKYQVRVVAPGGNINRIQIYGVFPATASGLNYTISDPVAVTLGFGTSIVPTTDRLYFGETDYDGASITAVRTLHFREQFVGAWQPVNVAVSDFEKFFDHHLFSDVLDVVVQASQANDGSAPIEELSVNSSTSTLGVSVTGERLFNPGTGDSTLTGSTTVALSGTINPDRSVRMRWTKYRVSVKNLITGVFYRDYAGAVQTAGFIRVVVRKRR
jgi:hypothetical protein